MRIARGLRTERVDEGRVTVCKGATGAVSSEMLAKKFALAFGIAVALPLTIHYGVATFSSEPKRSDYVTTQYDFRPNATTEERDKANREVKEQEARYDAVETVFQKHLFWVAVPLGLIALVVGALFNMQAIGAGLMFGGLFSIIDGYVNFWNELTAPFKFGSMLIALILLFVLGYLKIEARRSA